MHQVVGTELASRAAARLSRRRAQVFIQAVLHELVEPCVMAPSERLRFIPTISTPRLLDRHSSGTRAPFIVAMVCRYVTKERSATAQSAAIEAEEVEEVRHGLLREVISVSRPERRSSAWQLCKVSQCLTPRCAVLP